VSRSNPTNNTPNPATRWFEWSGSDGLVKYYDKDKKENVVVDKEFVFILLDETSTIRGWHEKSESGIYSNEVKDTRSSSFVVKSFKGGIIAEGFYSKIKDRVTANGGHFVTNLYIGYKNDEGELVIGSLQLKGAALGAWMDWSRENRDKIYSDAIEIIGYNELQKGKVTFRIPKFFTKKISGETNEQALELDKKLQEYLKGYFERNKTDQVEPTAKADEEIPYRNPDEDIPF
jgi:hypothetical protein